MDSVPAFSFRPITEDDQDLVLDIFRAAMKENTIRAYGQWNELAERTEHDQHFGFIASNGQIIQVDGQDAGFIAVKEYDDYTKLVSIHLIPAVQQRGIGQTIIEQLLTDAHAKGKPVRLEVLKGNPARALYERLGFKVVDTSDQHVDVMSTSGG